TTDTQAAAKEMHDSMQSIRESAPDGDFGAMQEKIGPLMRKSGERRAALEKTFLDDFKSLLTAEQSANWPRVERLPRREPWLRFGFVSGSSVDLTSLVDGLKLPDDARAKVRDTVEEYEQALDRVLVERENAAKEDQAKSAAAAGKGGEMNFDMDAMQAS